MLEINGYGIADDSKDGMELEDRVKKENCLYKKKIKRKPVRDSNKH